MFRTRSDKGSSLWEGSTVVIEMSTRWHMSLEKARSVIAVNINRTRRSSNEIVPYTLFAGTCGLFCSDDPDCM